MRREHVPYRASLRTTRERLLVLHDLAALPVPDVVVAERGDTYVVFATPQRNRYGAGLATVLAVAIVLAVLVLVASSVLWILLLPTALLPYLPLLVIDRPMLAVGAVDDDERPGVTRLTVHGEAWGELVDTLDAYMGHLPAPTDEVAVADAS